MEQGQALQVAPTDAELERAIASVPGVVSAGIDRSDVTGRSRLRLRLAPGEDEQAVAWSVVATLRERFGIALDPDAIRPRAARSAVPEGDPVHVVRGFEGPGGDGARSDGDGASSGSEVSGGAADVGRSPFDDRSPDLDDGPLDDVEPRPELDEPRPRSANELAFTREQLRRAAAQALAGVDDHDDVVDSDDLGGAADVLDLAELLDDAGSWAGSVRVGAPTPEPEVDADPRFVTVIPRAVIRDLQVRLDARSVHVAVVLGHGDRVEEGRATSVPTSHGTLRAVAEATVASLRGLSEGPLLVGIDRVAASHVEDSPAATVVLSLLTHRGEERLLGASIIHDCPERAVLRATLDALNRRVMPLLLDRDGEPDEER